VLGVKLKAPTSRAPADLILKVTLPPGVVLKEARQKGARCHGAGNSLEQRGSNIYFSDVFGPGVTASHVVMKVRISSKSSSRRGEAGKEIPYSPHFVRFWVFIPLEDGLPTLAQLFLAYPLIVSMRVFLLLRLAGASARIFQQGRLKKTASMGVLHIAGLQRGTS
jgi:hypothetical protein